MLGHERFTVTPRRGELIVFDKLARPLVEHIVLAVPTKITKGVLIAPTVLGNVMLGPTAEDVERKDDTDSTAAGLAYLRAEGARIMPELLQHEVTAVYAGLRAATEHVDYQLSVHAAEARRASAASARRACRPPWRSPSTCASSSDRRVCGLSLGTGRPSSSRCRTSASASSAPTSAAT
jgi:glycerol-3-phosphate dehydrogenase